MKKQVLIIAETLTAVITLHAQQKKEVSVKPAGTVKSAFEQKFPGASKVKWEQEGADLEVNFERGGKEMSAVFDQQGIWKETEREIPVKELPVKATVYLQQHYAGQKVKEVARIDKADGSVNYEAEVNKKDVMFDAEGGFLK